MKQKIKEELGSRTRKKHVVYYSGVLTCGALTRFMRFLFTGEEFSCASVVDSSATATTWIFAKGTSLKRSLSAAKASGVKVGAEISGYLVPASSSYTVLSGFSFPFTMLRNPLLKRDLLECEDEDMRLLMDDVLLKALILSRDDALFK